jgi:hypothetical protein
VSDEGERVQVFVSYARDDDAQPPDSPDAKGFISYLYDQLQYEFLSGKPRPKIWRDTRRIGKGDLFDPVIEDALGSSAILLVVLSRNWIASDYCRQELEHFAQHWSRASKDVRERIVLVGKRHIPPNERPPLLQGQQGFAFYALDESDEVAPETEFFVRGKVRDPRYVERVEELAKFLLQRGARLGGPIEVRSTAPSVAPNGRTVYLAKPADDMREAYDRLVKELQGRGYAIAPDPREEIPCTATAAAWIDEALAGAELSVHLVGERPGYAPEDEERIVKLQLARAGAKVPTAPSPGADADRSFHRMIWAPKVLQNDAAQAAHERDPAEVLGRFDRQLPADKLEGDTLSKFVDFLIQHLVNTAPALKRDKVAGSAAAETRLYLCHSPEDTDYAFDLQAALQDLQIEAILPVFDGPEPEVRSLHRKNLAECDAVALCWAAASEAWVRAHSSELRDWQGLGRTVRFAYRAVVAGPPAGSRKKYVKRVFPPSEIDIPLDLTDKERLSPELLDPLIPGASQGTP